MQKVKSIIASKKARIIAIMTMVMSLMVVSVSAEDTGSSVQTAVTGALSTVQTDVMSMISAVLPYALAIVGAVLVVTIGIKVFKRISGKG